MQKTIIFILAVATVGLAAFCALQNKQLRQARERAANAERALAAEQQTRESQEAQLREAQAARKRLDEQVQQFTQVTTTLREKDAKQSSNLTAIAQIMKGSTNHSADAQGGMFGKEMGNMLQTMMKDPAMRDMMRSQQKAAINQMYAGLFKEMNLPSETKEKLAAILTDSQMRSIEAAQGMFGQGAEGSDAFKETQAKMDAAQKQTEAEIKALLGEEGYAKYDDYQKNLGERMQLNSFQTTLEAASLPLQEQQSAQLLQIMKEEKAAVPPAIPSDNNRMPSSDMLTEEKINQQLRWMEDYNTRVAVRAKAVLTPEQYAKYEEYQKQQLAVQKFGLKMASEMFKNSPATPKP